MLLAPERAYLLNLLGAIATGSVLALCGCVNNAIAPIANKSAARPEPVTIHSASTSQKTQRLTRPAFHTVQRGDTLYSVAWGFGIDFRNLTKWNRLSNPNLIKVGQRLRLSAPPGQSNQASGTGRVKIPALTNPSKQLKPPPITKASSRPIKWSWPADGSVKTASAALGTKGIEIFGQRGKPVKAAADGTVVYSGSGLRGYGALIIVKHGEAFLSAYAHNDQLLVVEGATVKSGQEIAKMGDSDAKRVMLHFEIRRDGKAVEPLKYLPKR